MKKLALLLALFALTSVYAATPTAVWQGSDLADNVTKGGMTLHLNGNTASGGVVTIGSKSVYVETGMTSSSPHAGLEATVVLTVENVNTALYSGLFTMTDTYQNDSVGVESYCSYGNASYLYWVKGGGYVSGSSQFMTYPTDGAPHKVALGYAGSTSGSGGYIGCAVAFDGAYISGNTTVINAGYCITRINVGGYQDSQLPLTGARITRIAVYNSALSTADLATVTGEEDPEPEPEENDIWGNIGNATDGGIATDINYGNYNNLTFNFSVTNNICTTGIGSNGVVKIAKVTLLASSNNPSVPSSITLTQGETAITSTAIDISGTINVYGADGTVKATRTAYVYTFSSDVLFNTSTNIVLSSSANMRISVIQPANTLFKSGDWSPAIEIEGNYTPASEPSVSGAACVYDWTFTNTTEQTSSKTIVVAAGSQKKTSLSGDNNAHYTNEVDNLYTALKGYVRPWVNVQVAGGQSFAYYGTASAQANTILFALGPYGNSLFLATGANEDEILLARTTKQSDSVADSTLETITGVESPATTPHLYTLYLSSDKSTAKVAIDGEVVCTHAFQSVPTIGSGLQICGMFAGKPTNWNREETAATSTSAVNCLRVFDHELTDGEISMLMAEFKPYWPQPEPEGPVIIKDTATHTWTVDTTLGAYTFTNDEITELKNTAWKVILKSASELSATIGFGTQTAKQASHFIIESGTHNMTWLGGNANINFDTTGTADDPSILVKSGATLNFTAKDITGWSGTTKMGNLIRVNEGGTLNLLQSGSNTHYYQGRYYLDPGAVLDADSFASQKFRLNGGAVSGSEQLYVPDTTNGAPIATLSVVNGVHLATDNTKGLGIYVGENAELALNAAITSADTDEPIAKWGAGTLKLNGALSGYKGELTVNAGMLKLAQPTLGGSLTMMAGTVLDLHYDGVPTHGTVVLTATSLAINDNVQITVDGVTYVLAKTETTLTVQNAIAEVGGKQYGTIVAAAKAAGDGGVMTLLKSYDELEEEIEAAAIILTQIGETTSYTNNYKWAEGSSLIVTEIMPKPSDKPDEIIGQAGYDKNGLESGWVELLNTTNAWVDLKDYKFIRVNRSKANSKGDYGNFPSALISPNERYVFWTSERYANSASMADSAFETPVDEGKPHFFPEYNMMVWPDKVNPKKFAFVRFSYNPAGGTEKIIDTVVIPTDIPEGYSIIVEPIAEEAATVRYLCEAPTQGTANPSVEGLDKLGPNIGPLYEIKDGKKHTSVSEFGAVPPAKTTEAYTIQFALNPTMSPTESAKFRDMDAITGIKLIYRFGVEGTPQTNEVALTHTTDAKDQGDQYTAEIPAGDLAELNPGTLIQWKFLITDAAGNEWTSPSFHNPDDGYEWYGTITEPGDLNSANLPTWHMFLDSASLAQMDTDADKQTLPYNARAAIYDSSTSNYYDYVRIDLRGNTSKSFTKKSHGFRFAKAHPLTMRDIVSGKDIEEIRKTSLIGEPADPSYLRQLTAFWLLNKVGSPAPFDFPVRVNRNGEFYQMAFNSERFTDELIEDVYGLDKYGYSYKNVGTLKSGGGTTAGGIEKKTPDDGNESDISVLQNELRSKITAAQQVGGTTTDQLYGIDTTGLDNAALTKFVVQKFNLPAWFNYLAITRITQEMDDVWANISMYYDNAEMKEGARGTGTWMPLAYDMNVSFGQHYIEGGVGRTGPIGNKDRFKGHPFYGGNRVRCYGNDACTSTVNSGNDGFESVWQNAKFRRLYLRRLRTLMDQELKAPGTPETEIPMMVQMRKLEELMRVDAAEDRTKYPDDGSFSAIDVWGSSNFPKTMALGIDDLWTNYIVPRQTHLFVTHSITNVSDTWQVGYGVKCNAGIPEPQSPIAELKDGFSAAFDEASGMVAIQNANDEVVDMSGWILSGPLAMTLPMGTVVDSNDCVYVVADRRAYVAAIDADITDQIIVGNGELGTDPTAAIILKTADGTPVIAPAEKSEQEKYLRLWGFCGVPDVGDDGEGEFIIFTNLNQTAELDITDADIQFEKTTESKNRCHFKLSGKIAAGGWVRFNRNDIPWDKITNGIIDIKLTAANNAIIYSTVGLDQEAIGVKGTGYFAVYDFSNDTWGKMLITEAPGYEPPKPPAEDIVLTGSYPTGTNITLTADTTIVVSNATFNAALAFTGDFGATITLPADTASTVPQIASAGKLVFAGEGKLTISGAKELIAMTKGDLVVEGGELVLNATIANAKDSVVLMKGSYLQTGGKVTLDMTGTAKGYGLRWSDQKGFTATISGGEFVANIGSGEGSVAFKANKGSNDFIVSGGKLAGSISAIDGRIADVAGNIKINGDAVVDVTGVETATHARVFKTEKKVTISDTATVDVKAPGVESEAFSADNQITIEGGIVRVEACDDCFSAQTNIVVSGGIVYGHSISNDVFDSNGTMTISGGTIIAYTLAEGHEAFDTEPAAADEQSHTFTITGGTIVGLGGKNAAWPTDCNFEQETATMADLDPATYSEKYLVVDGVVETLYAKLPKIDDDFIVLATIRGLTDDPTVAATCPVETPIAENIPAWRKLKNNQQFLRFAEIYGNTADGAGGDTGEYIVLTNISTELNVDLSGLNVNVQKYDDWVEKKSSKCNFTLTSGTLAPGASIQLDQATYWSGSKQKITNGDLYIALTDADGKTVQSGETSNDFYPECDGNGASLLAKTFEKTIAMTTDDWEPSFRWFYFTIADNAATITGFGTTKLTETTLTLPRELGKVPVTLVDEGAFADCALTTLKVTLTNETLKVMATEGVSIAQYDMSESEGELVLGYALGSALNVSGNVVVGPTTATLAFDLGEGVTQEVKGTTDATAKQYGITVYSGTLNFTSTGGNTAFRGRAVTADGENAVVKLGTGDATGYTNPGTFIALRNGGRLDVTSRDTLCTPIELSDGTVKLIAGCATGNRGLDLYNANGNNWIISGDSTLAVDPAIGTGDGRKMLIRRGDWNVDVAADSLFTVEPTIVASAGNVSTVGKIVKTGAGTLYLAATDSTYTTETIVNGGTLKLAQGELKGALTMAADTALDLHFDGTPTHGTVVLTAASLNLADNVAITVDGVSYVIAKTETTLMVQNAIAEVEGKQYGTIIEAAKAAGNGGVMTLLKSYDELKAEIDAAAITLTQIGESNSYTNNFKWAVGTSLIISEIMPKPSDKPDEIIGQAGYDKNGLESGWVELLNTANAWVDLKDYKFIRVNRSKANSKGDYGNFPSALISPNERYVFWTSERYANSASMADSAFETPVDEGKPHFFPEYNMMVWPDKVNPKKFAFVRFSYNPEGGTEQIIDTVVIPSDIPEGYSIIVESIEEEEATVRYLCEAPTQGTENPSVEGLDKLGPNIGPLYEIKDGKKHTSVSEFGAVPPAKTTEAYTIPFSLNPTMSPTESAKFRDMDAITGIKLIYRFGVEGTPQTNEVALTHTTDAKDQGDQYTAEIPAEDLAALNPGTLIQWKFLITDAAGNEWMSPSFHNPDDGYEWYGTITEPGDLNSANLPTWHMFVDSESLKQMDKDADDQSLPYNARAAIYDASTSNYYDYVRIDLRGNTSKNFSKKSHGLRFAKAHPLTMRDIVSGKDIEEIRKTSLISEVGDPTYLRQLTAFWLLNKVGSLAPFDFPVRVNRNGEFYQMAFNSERFTDELIEDVYGLDKYGYSYKNVGTLKSGSGTTAGGIEKKTPDDGNESDISVLQNELRSKIKAAQQVGGTSSAQLNGTDTTGLGNAELTKFVVQKFNLPAWLNYLAITKITQECDDVWANISVYYDNAEMKEGTRGTDTWMPLAYDMNLSIGQWHAADLSSSQRKGLMSTNDWFKSHPFYGGNRVRCWSDASYTSVKNSGNDGVESVWQNAKFRRLYLRRLRTLMDQELKAPGTPEEEVPFMVEMRKIAKVIAEDAVTDRQKYPAASANIGAINVWPTFPAGVDAGLEDIWNNYVVPRREHFYVTHAAEGHDASEIGYASKLCAGIPAAQSPIADLKVGFTAAFDEASGMVAIQNANDEVVDMSGWILSGPMAMTLPNGTVVDANDSVYIVADRRAYVAAIEEEITDQVIVGNATLGADPTAAVLLSAADGTPVIAPETKSEQEKYLRLWGICGAPDKDNDDAGEFIIFTNLNQTAALDVSGAEFQTEKNGAEHEDRCHFFIAAGTTIPAGGWLRINRNDIPWTKITDNKIDIWLKDSKGVLIYQLYLEQEALGVRETGSFAVYDNAAGTWSTMLITEAPGYEPPPPAPETTVITGVVSVATSYDGEAYIISNATLNAKLSFTNPAGVTLTLADETTGDTNGKIYVEGPLTIKGDGTLTLSADTELMNVGGLTINGGTLNLTSSYNKKIRTVVMRGSYYQDAGTVTLNVTGKKDDKNALGFYWENCTDAVYTAKLEGTAVFNATMASPKKSEAFRSENSGVKFSIGGDAVVTANFSGKSGELIETDADIEIKGGAKVNVTSTATDGKVLEAAGKITVKKATIDITATGADTEAFSAGDTISIENKNAVLRVTSTDDCFNAQTNISVSAGTIYGHSISNDVFDSNGAMTISGGTIVAYTLAYDETTGKGHTAFDTECYPDNGLDHTFKITGGTVIGLGGKNGAWPTNCVFSQNVYTNMACAAADYSNKYLKLETLLKDTIFGLPEITDEFVLLTTTADWSGEPTVSDTAPTGEPIAEDIPVWIVNKSPQQALRIIEIYGSTSRGTKEEGNEGDVGEFVVITNMSNKAVDLKGMALKSEKFKSDKYSTSFDIAMTNGQIAANGTYKLLQEEVWPTNKITNGSIRMTITDNTGTQIQEANLKFKDEADQKGASMLANNLNNPCNDWYVGPIHDPAGPTPAPGSESEVVPTEEPNTYIVTPTDETKRDPVIQNVKDGDTLIINGGAVDSLTVDNTDVTIKVMNTAGEIEITKAVKGFGEGLTFSTELDAMKTVDVPVESGTEPIKVQPELANSGEAIEPFVVGDDASVGVKTIPGLTYKLLRMSEIGGETEVVATEVATSARIELKDGAKPADKAFYKVQVTK